MLFLIILGIIVLAWIAINVIELIRGQYDRYVFIGSTALASIATIFLLLITGFLVLTLPSSVVEVNTYTYDLDGSEIVETYNDKGVSYLNYYYIDGGVKKSGEALTVNSEVNGNSTVEVIVESHGHPAIFPGSWSEERYKFD